MSTQNYQNHTRKAPMAFYASVLTAFALFIAAMLFYFQSDCSPSGCNRNLYLMIALLSMATLLAVYYARMFALRAQDRAIRAEENIRHFAVSGRLLDPELTISQIIALRFVSDEELVSLAERACREKMSSKDIKQAIRHWKADEYRV